MDKKDKNEKMEKKQAKELQEKVDILKEMNKWQERMEWVEKT